MYIANSTAYIAVHTANSLQLKTLNYLPHSVYSSVYVCLNAIVLTRDQTSVNGSIKKYCHTMYMIRQSSPSVSDSRHTIIFFPGTAGPLRTDDHLVKS